MSKFAMLRIVVRRGAQHHHHALALNLVIRAHRAGLAGATMVEVVAGFGAAHRSHTAREMGAQRRHRLRDPHRRYRRQARPVPRRRPLTDRRARCGHRRNGHRRNRSDPHNRTVIPAYFLPVLALGAVGAIARYLLDAYIATRFPSILPWGTFAVNMSGSSCSACSPE